MNEHDILGIISARIIGKYSGKVQGIKAQRIEVQSVKAQVASLGSVVATVVWLWKTATAGDIRRDNGHNLHREGGRWR